MIRDQEQAAGDSRKIDPLLHEMRNAETDEIAASCEMTGVHMDRQARKSAPFEESIRNIATNHVALSEPAAA
jgi:acyl-CoA thioester hydrolase